MISRKRKVRLKKLIDKQKLQLFKIETEIENTKDYRNRHQLLTAWREKRIYVEDLKRMSNKLN